MQINSLTFTRFIAAIAIVFFHYGKDLAIFNNSYLKSFVNQANLGVSYFFILSGFVMVIAYHNKKKINIFHYLKNRFARIYPLYFFAILLVLLVQLFKGINFYNLSLNVFMLQSWFPSKALTINPPGWSLSVELIFYVCFPLFYNYLYTKFSLKIIALSSLLFWLISQLVYLLVVTKMIQLDFYSLKGVTYHPIFHLNQFIIGNLSGLFFVAKLKNRQGYFFKYIVLLLMLFTSVLLLNLNVFLHNGLLAIIFAPLIILLALSKDRVTQFFSKKPFIILGEISFGIYILQFPIWILLSDYRMEKYLGLNKTLDINLIFSMKLLTLIVCSYITYKYIEQPMRSKIIKI